MKKRIIEVYRNGELYDVDEMECTDAYWNELHDSLKKKHYVKILSFNNEKLAYDEGE